MRMKDRLVTYLEQYRKKRVLVLGIGVSNRPLIRKLLSCGLDVTACDQAERPALDEEVLELERAGAKLSVGKDYLNDLAGDVIFRTPGLHPDEPALRRLREGGAVVTSEMAVFFAVCPCRTIAVTGSDGKTTTTTLIAEMLRRAGMRVFVGGNIGQPLLPRVGEMRPGDFAVVELSSFQLMDMVCAPDISVVTNLAPNHLDKHKDMAEYIAAKQNIYLHQKRTGLLVVNADNRLTAEFAATARGTVRTFSRGKTPDADAFFDGETIFLDGRALMCRSEIQIPGLHNVENYMAAACALKGLVADDEIRATAREFSGVEHRIELVRTLREVQYYNDSIASSPSRVIAGLHAFQQKLILIAGGYDKHIPFDELGAEIPGHVKTLILCGATSHQIEQAVRNAKEYRTDQPEILHAHDLAEAVRLARKVSAPGDVVTLSPACAAFDQFKDFMERGKTYKKLVMELE